MFQDGPEELLGHLRRAHFVGVGKVVAIGRRGPAQAGERPGMQTQRIAHIVETDAMGELGVDQGDHMTPGTEGARFVLDPGSPRQLGHQKVRNEVANLPQQDSVLKAAGTFLFVFSSLPCGRAKQNVPAFSQILWDGCVKWCKVVFSRQG